MGFGDVAWVDRLPEGVVWGWEESFYTPGGGRLVRGVDEVKDVFFDIEFGAEGSCMMKIS